MALTKEDKLEHVQKFGKHGTDTGSPEVQIAMLTAAHQRAHRAPADAQATTTTRAAACSSSSGAVAGS